MVRSTHPIILVCQGHHERQAVILSVAQAAALAGLCSKSIEGTGKSRQLSRSMQQPNNTSHREPIFRSCTQLNLNRTGFSVCIDARF
jgi:hypothetical protein